MAYLAWRQSPDPFRTGWRQPADASLTPDGGLLLHGRRYYFAEDEAAIEVWRDGQRQVVPSLQPPSIDHAAQASERQAGEQSLTAPMNGIVVKVLVEEGQQVEAHQTLLVLEAMKMEHNIQAPFPATVSRLHLKPGAMASAGAALVDLAAWPPSCAY